MIRRTARRLWEAETIRYLMAGGTNTLLTLVIYWFMLPWTTYTVAFTASFAVGVFSGFALNTYAVFRARWSWKKFAAFPTIPLINYIVGLGLIWLLVAHMGIDKRLAPVITTVLTLPLSFVMTRWLISGVGLNRTDKAAK